MSHEITFDEFAEAEVAAEDEWIDRHGVDRSPDAEGKRIDDAYEQHVQAQLKADLDRPLSCKWCRMPNGDHHPDCVGATAGKTAADILKFKQEYEMNFMEPAQEKLAEAMDNEINAALGMPVGPLKDGPSFWKIQSGTEVFVANKDNELRPHRMKNDAVYTNDQVMDVEDSKSPWGFVFPMGKTNRSGNVAIVSTLRELAGSGFVVIQTGLKKWPYIIMKRGHAIVVIGKLERFVGRSGGTCRKLGTKITL